MINSDPEINIDTLMSRLRVETEKYRLGQPVADDNVGQSPQRPQSREIHLAKPTRLPRPRCVSAVPAEIKLVLSDPDNCDDQSAFQFAIEGGGNISDILGRLDREFIHAAYWAVLGRLPDNEGLETYLRLLRSGISKLEILEFLRHSAEGQKKSARVVGLALKLFILKIYRLPVLGNFVRSIAALWNLPAQQRTDRAVAGHILSLIERSQMNARTSLLTVNRALSDLSYGHNQQTAYAESKADQDSLNLEAISEDISRLRDDHGSLHKLQATKAASDDVNNIKTSLDNIRRALKSLESSKADLAFAVSAHDKFANALQAKVGRDEVSELSARSRNEAMQSLEFVRTENKAILEAALNGVTDKFAALAQSKVDHSAWEAARADAKISLDNALRELNQALLSVSETKADRIALEVAVEEGQAALAKLGESKADKSSLGDVNQSLVRALATKADRRELTLLTNHLVSLLETRLTREEIASLEESVKLLTSQSEFNRAAVEEIVGEFRVSLKHVGNETRSNLEAALNGVAEKLAALAQSKVDHSALEAARAEAKVGLDNALSQLNQALLSLSESKADRTALEVVVGENRNSIDLVRNDNKASLEAALERARETFSALAQTKIDHSVLEAARAESKASLENAVAQLNQTLLSVSESKAGRAELEAVVEKNSDLLEVMRNDNKANLEAALDNIRKMFVALTQTKVDHSALEAASASAKVSLDGAVNQLNQALQSVSETKADRAAIEAVAGENRNLVELLRSDNKASLEAALDSVRETFAALTRTKVDHSTLDAARAAAKLSLDNAVDQLNQALLSISESKADRTALEAAVAEGRESIEASQKYSQEALFRALTPVTAQARDNKRNLIDQERRLRLLLEEARKRLPKPLSTVQLKNMVAEEDHLLDAMYASFEDIFRGSREDIKQRQSIYLPYIRDLKAGLQRSLVVDIGCGRGEWLETLRDEGVQSRGVDLNRVFLDSCRELKLDVVERDAVTYLREQAPNSLGVVTSFHVIEHLSHKTLIAFLDAAFRALKPEGLLILETPNPKNLQVGSCNFYLDPTHRNPLPPDLMRYLLEARGFVQIETKELHPSSPENRITDGAPAVIDTLNRFFFSAQDYAVIGKKL